MDPNSPPAAWKWRQSRPALRLEALAARYLHCRCAVQRSPRPLVSFTFDDFPRSALAVAGRILMDYGARGTYYAALGLQGRRTVVGEMFDREDLAKLTGDGHELACHTLRHTRCCELPVEALLESCERNRNLIADVPGGRPATSFSFPEGVVTSRAKAALGPIYETCRTIEPGINIDPVDAAFLRAYPVYSRCAPGVLGRMVRRNAERNGWLIFYTHDVRPDASPYGCTPSEFHDLVRCVAQSGAEVLTVSEAWSRFRLRAEAAN